MIRWLLPIASAALVAAPLHAQDAADPPPAASNLRVALALMALKHAAPHNEATRFVRTTPKRPPAVVARAQYGPFRVVASDRVEMVGATDRATPEQFAALLRDFPGIRRIDMVECPGTHDDRANLRLGRMVRAAGIATHVPANGSVRSGAVDLFLAGRERVVADGAEFAVHSWRDPQGREASDFAPDAPPNRAYLDYYREMGMDPAEARAFYAFTNSVPHREALWLRGAEMRRWTAGMEDSRPRPLLANAAEAEPSIAAPKVTPKPASRQPVELTLLDLSVLDRAGLARSHPAMAMLDSTRRL